MTDSRRRIIRLTTLGLVVIVLLVCSTLYIQFYAIDGASLQQGQERAGELLAALERYQQTIGRYPSALSGLVPEYLPAVPRPAWRYEYYYDACPQGTGYTLYYRLGGTADDYCGYSSKAREWKCADSLPPYSYDSPCHD
jgi:hypothetical protein